MLFWLYWGIVVLLALACLAELWRRDSGWRDAATAALVLVPLLLRAFLVK